MLPPESMVHAIGFSPFPVVEYEKFPLLWANTIPAADATISALDEKSNNFFMHFSFTLKWFSNYVLNEAPRCSELHLRAHVGLRQYYALFVRSKAFAGMRTTLRHTSAGQT
jgi:hypothetical protein